MHLRKECWNEELYNYGEFVCLDKLRATNRKSINYLKVG